MNSVKFSNDTGKMYSYIQDLDFNLICYKKNGNVFFQNETADSQSDRQSESSTPSSTPAVDNPLQTSHPNFILPAGASEFIPSPLNFGV